jgi:prophage maintenance system killer protein
MAVQDFYRNNKRHALTMLAAFLSILGLEAISF